MIPVIDFASSAKRPRAGGSAILALGQAFRRTSAAMSGPVKRISRWVRRDGKRQSAQAEALANLTHLYRQRHLLLIEKEIVAAERKEAQRLHRATSDFDRRLRAINAQLLSIG